MTSDLLKIETVKTEAGVLQMVSAKALHERLGVKRDFSTWIKNRIDTYGFVKDTDYFVNSPILANQTKGEKVGKGVFPKSGENLVGRPNVDYNLGMDMAKELAMLEKNEAGRAARKYFIACEAELHKKQDKVLSTETQIVLEQKTVIEELNNRLTAKATRLTFIESATNNSLQTNHIARENAIKEKWNDLVDNFALHDNALSDNSLYTGHYKYREFIRLECLKKTILQYDGLLAAFTKNPTDEQKSAVFEMIYKDTLNLMTLVATQMPFDYELWIDWTNGRIDTALEFLKGKISECWSHEIYLATKS